MTSARLHERLAAAELDWIVPDWPVPAGVGALVTTRNGGVSRGACATMNVGARDADSVEAIEENRRRLCALLPADPRWLKQVHGADVVVHVGGDPGDLTADAAVTRERGVVCAVQVADCLPVLLADRHGRAAGIAHAGWRGLAAGVVERTVETLARLGTPPHDLVAWLGPAIGPAAFEVGPEVRTAFVASDAGADAHFVPGAPGKWQADLYGLARRRLAASGVVPVSGGGYCTRTDAGRFFSWRRDRDCGRMAALVWLDADAHV
jgi:YfiH family protein